MGANQVDPPDSFLLPETCDSSLASIDAQALPFLNKVDILTQADDGRLA